MSGRVFYVCRVLPDYRKPIVAMWSRGLSEPLVVANGNPPDDGTALKSLMSKSDLIDYIDVRNRWLFGSRLIHQRYSTLARELRTGDIVVLEESPRTINLAPFLAHLSKRNIPVLLWGHFASNSRIMGSRHPFDRYRLYLANKATGCIVYTDAYKEMLSAFVDPARIFVANNTIDSEPLVSRRAKLDSEGLASVRRRLGVEPDSVVVTYVGRLIKDKRIDRLPGVIDAIRKTHKCTLITIGDGPERHYLSTIANMPNAALVDLGASTDPDVLAPAVFAADVMLQPGYAGLSVNLGLLLGTPVVTVPKPDNCLFHSPEVAFVVPGHNGAFSNTPSPQSLAETILSILPERHRYAENARTYADTHLSADRMIQGLLEAVDFARTARKAKT